MDQEFDSRADCVTYLREALGSPSLNEKAEAAVFEKLTDACEVPAEAEAAPQSPFEMRLGRWVVRDEDLKLFGAVKDSVVALASANYLLGDLTAAGAASLAFAMLQLFRNAYRFGARVSRPQSRFLAVLKRAGRPLSVGELLQALGPNDPSWNEAVVRQELAALQQVPTRNGAVAFVQSTADSRWLPAGF
jgi:hypothetical protein